MFEVQRKALDPLHSGDFVTLMNTFADKTNLEVKLKRNLPCDEQKLLSDPEFEI